MLDFLDHIFTPTLYMIMGKIYIFIILCAFIKKIHQTIYRNLYFYSYYFDKITTPYHYVNVMYFMSPSKVNAYYGILKDTEPTNDNVRNLIKFLKIRMLKIGLPKPKN